MDTLIQDIRFALRMLRKNLGFAAVAILVLAVGIGANTAIFSFVDAVLLRPLPYPDSDRLVVIQDQYDQIGAVPISYPQFLFWKDQHQIFDHLINMRAGAAPLIGRGEPEQVKTLNISADTFDGLGISSAKGRHFEPKDDLRSSEPVAMLTDSFWRSHFHSSDSALGERLTLADRVYTVVGVLPATFNLGGQVDVVLPMRLDTQIAPEHLNFMTVIGKLRPGVTLAQGRAAVESVFPAYHKADEDLTGVVLTPYRDTLVAGSRSLLLVLLGAVFAVLLIACTNTANLLLARAAAREKEVAVRIALGAGRMRLARQLLTESLLLGCIGGVLGVLLAWSSMGALRSLLAQRLPQQIPAQLDLRVLLFAGGISLLTSIVFGLAPVVQILRGNLHDRLKQGGRQSSGSPGQRTRQVLVVAEVAFSLVLLACAGLLVRSLFRLINVDKGFSTDHVLTMSVDPSSVKYADARKEINYIQQITQSVSHLPGVESAGFVYTLPLAGNSTNGGVMIQGHEGKGTPPNADKQYLDGDYFQAMRIPLLKGRLFRSSDTIDSSKVVIINQAFAREIFPNEDPIGKRVNVNWGDTGWCEVIGVVGNQKTETLATPDHPSTYMLYAQNPDIMKFMGFNLVVRTSQEPLGAVNDVRRALQQIDPNQTVGNIKTMDEQLSQSLAPQLAPVWLLGGFSTIAVFLASIGIYGVLSFFVLQRRQEIGVRMALGAQRSNVLGIVLSQGARLIAIGVVIGVGAAFLAARALASLLYGIKPTDLPTFVGVSLLLGMLGLLACAVPALRATQVDPLVVLRNE